MLVNIDISTYVHPFLDRVCENKSFSQEMLYPFVDQYADTKVTDLLFNIYCNYSATDSKVCGTFEDKYLQTVENGYEVNYKSTFGSLYKINREYGTDPFGVWIERCRQKGIHPWLSFRMNDAHNNGDMPYSSRTDFFYEAKEKGWTLGSDYGYYGYNFDYGVEEIRDRMCAYIAEQLERYDVDGIELDFLREIICFRYHTADMTQCIAVMNSFIDRVRAIVKRAEDKKGHNILLAVRVMRDYEQSLRYGFDPTAWDVDVIVPSPRWASSDSGIKVAEWKKLCPNAKVFPCIETLLAVEPDHTGVMSAETVRGHAASFMAQGADGIYLYNFFSNPNTPYTEHSKEGHPYERNMSVYNSLDKYPKRFAVVGQSSEHYPDSFPTWRPLPAESGEIEITIGEIPKDKTTALIVGVEGDIAKAQITLNAKPCKNWQSIDLTYIDGIGAQPKGYVNDSTLCYKCPVDTEPVCKLTFNGVKVNWLEIIAY